MTTTTLATEATHYLEAVDLLRSLGLEVRWRPEAEELARPSPARHPSGAGMCGRCGSLVVRINGRHVCLRP